MIISASRRTDIPSYYADWFYNRIKEGYVCVRNPMNVHQISRISLSPDVIDGIVFWTKNPHPMMDRLDLLKNYMYYFQFTINSYGRDIEANIPSKNDIIIPTFRTLSDKIGHERVIWRYDPILLTEKYSVDLYRNTKSNKKDLGLLPLETAAMYEIAHRMSEIALKYGIKMESCAEKINLDQFGIEHGHCIDCSLFERLLGCRLDLDKDKNQREECGCVASVDIGMYNTCKNGCKYCYANYSANTVAKHYASHNPESSLISGVIGDEDVVKDRVVKSCKDCQLNLF